MNNVNKNIELSTHKIEIAELDEHKLSVKFIICDFEPNKNGVQLNREKIDDWVSSLLNQPLVGKVAFNKDGELDFTGHNVKFVKAKDKDGNEYVDVEFDTSAFGTFTSVGIEEIDDVEYIVANATVWRRFKNASDIIISRVNNGTMNTSWELSVNEYRYAIVNGKKTKIIDSATFIGHALLGQHVESAYDSSKALQVASKNENQFDREFNNAIIEDIMVANQNGGETVENEKNVNVSENQVNEPVVEPDANVEPKSEPDVSNVVEPNTTEPEVSALTITDIQRKLEEKIGDLYSVYPAYIFPEENTVYARSWRMNTTEFKKFTYEVENDVVKVSKPTDVTMTFSAFDADIKVSEMEEKLNVSTDALVKANETIKSLETQVSELVPYKEKFEEQEQIRIEAEQAEKRTALSEYALKSELITSEELESDENIKTLIHNVDENAIKSIIAERFMKKLDEKQNVVETSEKSETKENIEKVNLSSVVDEVEHKGFSVKSYLSKK